MRSLRYRGTDPRRRTFLHGRCPLSYLRSLLSRLVVGCVSASVILTGCGGNSTVPNGSGVGAGQDPNYNYYWFNITNNTGKNDRDHPKGEYVWITRYNDNGNYFDRWQITGADCVAPGETIQRDIRFSKDHYGHSVKIRAEVKAYGATSCNAATISDFYTPTCHTDFQTARGVDLSWILGSVNIVVRPPHFEMDMLCSIDQGSSGDPPAPSLIKLGGS